MGIKQDIIRRIDDVDEERLQQLYEAAFNGYYDRGSEFARGVDQALAMLAGTVDIDEVEELLQ